MTGLGPEHGHAACAGDRLHFVRTGDGQPLLLLHGAYGSGEGLLTTPFGETLAQRFSILAPDSLGHGLSDAPADPDRYQARQRADQLVAVLDAAGAARVHVCGYSMGGWMASALATFHPDRLLSLTIGGWDVLDGMYTPARLWGLETIDYETLTGMIRNSRPELLADRSPSREPGLAAAINGMNDLTGLADGVLQCGVPTAIWMGRDDAYDAAARRFADEHALTYLSLPGDHAAVLQDHGVEAAGAVADFIATNALLPQARPNAPD
jgi:pimeloyl-ACP methyl ester carboxylesterase|tara:strand:- start:4645 stop:5442 length:798 start_codon:yes stop_codon:yes gene_type:complete